MIIKSGILKKIEPSDIIDGCLIIPSSVEIIGYEACYNNNDLISLTIPSTVKVISPGAFSGCSNLENVSFNEGLVSIYDRAFLWCYKIKKLNLPTTLERIGMYAFQSLNNIEKLIIPSNVNYIGESAFGKCINLKEVNILSSLEELYPSLFAECINLEKINLPPTITKIYSSVFLLCSNLKNIELPESITSIGDGAFSKSGLEKIVIPNSVEKLGDSVFYGCLNLKRAKISENIKEISEYTFYECASLEEVEILGNILAISSKAFGGCESLKSIDLKDSIISLGDSAFWKCSSLIEVKIPKNLDIIQESCFSECKNLKNIIFNENLLEIENWAFYGCTHLENISLPLKLKKIHNGAFSYCKFESVEIPKSVTYLGSSAFYCNNISLYHTTCMDVQPHLKTLTIINANTNERIVEKIEKSNKAHFDSRFEISVENGREFKFFDYENNWVTLNCLDYHKCNNVSEYKKLYEWSKTKKYLPSMVVIKNMSISDIKNFYINGNAKKWKKLVELSKIDYDEEKIGLFKLAYVLGLFSKSGKESDRAFEFIKKYFIKKVKIGEYHIRFGELNTFEMGYNKEFAELVFKYYPKYKRKFLTIKANDYFSAVYNNFENIKIMYPNKIVKTNTINDMLTPEICLNVARSKIYYNVEKGNEEFSKNMALYGYSQNDFDLAQSLFNEGKSIPKENLTLHIKTDETNKFVNYELLEKDNPLGIILGNITNCCQTINGVAKSCVEYGLSKRNSKFMVFRSKGRIIGQSWVWYDEKTKKICLDNVEIPRSVSKKIISGLILKVELIACLKRVAKGFIEEMKTKGLEVNSVTVGAGYNDLNGWMGMNFKKVEDQPKLSDYDGYTDASRQYVLYSK